MIELSNSKKTFLGRHYGRNRFALECHLHAVQMREAGKDWEDIDPTIEELDTDGSTINFTRTPMLVKIGEDSRRRVYPDRTDLSYWIEFQKPFASMGKPTRKDRWFYWNFTHSIIGVLVTNTGVKFGFRLKDNQAPTSITIPFSTQGITRQGRILYHDDKVVAELRQPIATGSNLDAEGQPVQKDCDIAFAAGKVTISLDPTGLEYPIEIDPTLEVQVGASANDGYELESTGAMNIAGVVVYNQSNVAASLRRWGGYRFVSASFPVQGTIIDVAYLKIHTYDTTYDDANFNIHFAELAAPAAFTTTAGNITGRDRTENSVPWIADNIAAGVMGWYNSPSLAGAGSPAEEIWITDNLSPTTIVVITRPNQDLTRTLYARSWDNTTSPANTWGAILHLEWTTGGWANIAKVNGVASAAIAKMNGVAVAAIAKVNGVAV